MALKFEALLSLAKIAANAKPSAPVAYSFNGENFSYNEVQETLRKEFNELAPDFRAYRENKNMIFRLIEESLSEVVPEKVKQNYEQFAEVKRFAQGDKPIFRRKTLNNNRTRGKQFITRVGLAGIYEVFRLGAAQESFEIPTSAIGGAAQIGFEEYLDGRVDWAELLNIIYEAIDDLVYEEIGAALGEGIAQLPGAHVVTENTFNEAAFDELLMRAKMYGPVTIYCTNEFAVKMIPQEAWRYTEAMKDELYRTGRLTGYKGEKVVVLPNSYKSVYEDEKVLDPSICWIIPNGADNKPVKVAFEGELYTNEFENYDWSRDIHVYQKVGVACLMDSAVHVYKDTSLTKTKPFVLGDTVKNPVDIRGTVSTAEKKAYKPVDSSNFTAGTTDVSSYYVWNATSGTYEQATGTAVANTVYYEEM